MMSQQLSLRFAVTLTVAVLLTTATAQGQTADAKSQPTGSIAGRVTLNEKGLADVVVAAQSGDRPGAQPVSRAKTDANGRYRLTGLVAGQYQVVAIAPAMTMAEQTGSQNSFRRGQSVVLAAGEDVDDIDIKLVRGSVIAGRISDADGKPVVQQRVNLQLVDQNGNATRQSDVFMWSYQMSQTDDRGVYRIYGLAAGRYRVSVGSSESGIISTTNRAFYPLTFYGDTTEAAKARLIELEEGGEVTNIDIRLGRPANTFAAVGRVVDGQTGQPVPGIRVLYGPARPNQPFYGGIVTLPSGSRGEFRLEGLEPGRYGISISAGFESSAFYSDPLFFEVADADVTNLELKVTRGLTMSGVVVFEGSRAKELMQQIGVLRVTADITSPSNPQNRSASSSALTADGTFNITGVRPGKARLMVSAIYSSPLRGVTTLRVERGGVDVTQNLEVQPGEPVAGLRIVAALGAGTIRGTVRFVGGEPPPNIRLYVRAQREGAAYPSAGTIVDARGRFAISNVTSGTYEVILSFSYEGIASARPPRPLKQIVVVSDDGETQVDFVVDLAAKEGGP